MIRMAHRIATQQVRIARHNGMPLADYDDFYRRLKEKTQRTNLVPSTSMIVDDVLRLVMSDPDKKWDLKELPRVVPPLEDLFVEWSTRDDKSGWKQVGVSLFSTQFDELIKHKPETVAAYRMVAAERGLKPPKWSIAALMFGTIDGEPNVLPHFISIVLDEEGQLSPLSDFIGTWGPPWIVVFLAMSLANCKNVRQVDATEAEGPTAKWIRRQKAPTIRYHILDINPMKEVLRTEGGIEHNGLKKALHICRGHFATYTPDKPLFGQITGTFWKPSHVRGQIEQGAVVKDYRISNVVGGTEAAETKAL